jgi:hypothetical protein
VARPVAKKSHPEELACELADGCLALARSADKHIAPGLRCLWSKWLLLRRKMSLLN